MRWLALIALLGCKQIAEDADPTGDVVDLADAYCAAHPELPCGKVYMCEAPADNELGHIEICIPQFYSVQLAEAVYGQCELSPHPRFDDGNLCWWCCGDGCTRGCNALNGCFCEVQP